MDNNLFGKTLSGLNDIVKSLHLPGYTAMQIADWLYKKNISSIDEMTNLSKPVRSILHKEYKIHLNSFVKEQTSNDGTRKYLFDVGDDKYIETVFIPEGKRKTLCISTQTGCKMGCIFCLTGKQGFQGNLSEGEILSQIKNIPEHGSITNIVYMGMGEPCDNVDAVLNSLEILTSGYGFSMSPRRITVSTIGILPEIRQLIEKSNCHLAVSLHSPIEDERKYLVPSEKKHPIENIVKTLKEYDLGRQRRISFEYIMFKGLNDTNAHVNKLASLLNGLHCRINLIRYHPVAGSSLQCSDEDTINDFRNRLNEKGIFTTIRTSRGLDISAACGMLATKLKSKSNSR